MIENENDDKADTAPVPLLTIGIPTYNRAELLRRQLATILPQVAEHESQVEILISDNASPDHTESVIREYQKTYRIRYVRNDVNIGTNGNIQRLTEEARGEFFWMQGDDDLLRDGAVTHILQVLNREPGIDCIFMNHISCSEDLFNQWGLKTSAYPVDGALQCESQGEFFVDHWEDIALLATKQPVFCFIGSHVVRLSRWRAQSYSVEPAEGFPNVEATFGHSCRVARMMVGRPTYYIGFPYIILLIGAQHWTNSWMPFVLLARVTDLSDVLAGLGADKRAVYEYRKTLFRMCSDQFWALLYRREVKRGRDYSEWGLVRRYWRHPEFWKMLGRPQRFIRLFFADRVLMPYWRFRAAVGKRINQPVRLFIRRIRGSGSG